MHGQEGRRPGAAGTVDILRRFLPRGLASLALIAGLSFLTGLAEAGVLVLITSVAVSTTDGATAVELGPFSMAPRTVLLGALGLLAVNVGGGVVLAKRVAATNARAAFTARSRLLDRFHRSSYERKSRNRLGSLQEALTTYVDRFNQAFTALSNLLTAGLNLVSFALAAMLISPGAAVALTAMGALLTLVIRPVAGRTRKASLALRDRRRVYAEGATESVLLAREQTVFGVTEQAGVRLGRVDEEVAEQFRRARFLATVTPRLYQGVAFLAAIASLWILTGIDVQNLAQIGAVVLLLLRSLSYGQVVLASLQQLSEHRPFVEHLVDLIDDYEAEPRHRGAADLDDVRRIDLQGLSFAYPGSAPALQDVDLTIEAGETIGVLGPSGAGKTTLINLLLRLYEPTSGTITIDGIDLREIEDDSWHRLAAIVPQEPRLLHGTIGDNIRFLRDLGPEAVERATREANIAAFVDRLPDGLDAPVGELGSSLSGGQRQRICIARALAGDPRMLVLDEPTSALDGESEAAIQRTLEQLKGRVTMVLVAHRISTLSICDRLVVLQSGRVVSTGTPAELLETSTYYRDALRLAGL